ncbi:hypothetical protein ACOME3_005551 [Neoechinorhynchus agilis]
MSTDSIIGRSLGRADSMYLLQNPSRPHLFDCEDSPKGGKCITLQVIDVFSKRELSRRVDDGEKCRKNTRIRIFNDTHNLFRLNRQNHSIDVNSALNLSAVNWLNECQIEMSLKTKSSDGSLVCIRDSRMILLLVKIEWNIVRLLINCKGRFVRKAIENLKISDGHWHDLRLQYFPNEVKLRIDKVFYVSSFCSETHINDQLDVKNVQLSIGGCVIDKRSKVQGISGCLGNVSINGAHLPQNGYDFKNGIGCLEEICNVCIRSPCLNSGQCIELQEKRQCVCTPRFTGDSCQIDQTPCLSAPCLDDEQCLQIIKNSHLSHRCVRHNDFLRRSPNKTLSRSSDNMSVSEDDLLTMMMTGVLITTILFLLSIVIIILFTSYHIRTPANQIACCNKSTNLSTLNKYDDSPTISNEGDLRPLIGSASVFNRANSNSPPRENEYFLPRTTSHLKSNKMYNRFTRFTRSERNSWRINPRRLDSVKRHRDTIT